ncbi:SCO family protein [Hydrogenivirga sp.]
MYFRCYLIPLLVVLLFAYMSSCSLNKKASYNGVVYEKPSPELCMRGWDGTSERRVCLSDFRGEVVLLFFGYTHCPDVCPRTMQTLSETLKLLSPEDRKRVRVVFVSLDPERDTPEKAQAYAGFFGESFIGLTDSPDRVRAVAKSFKVFYRKVEGESRGGYLVDHTALLYLIPPSGDFMLLYPVVRQKPELIAQDVESFL